MTAYSLFYNNAGTPTKIELADAESGSGISRIESLTRDSVLTAGSAFAVPQYTLGSDNIMVFRDGLLCIEGESGQYQEATETTITFNEDLAIDTQIVVIGPTSAKFVSASRSSVVSAGSSFAVPKYEMGSGRLSIFYNGVLCIEGSQYNEETVDTITFADDLPTDVEIVSVII